MKGFVHVDYIIAISIMILIFAFSVYFTTNFLIPTQEIGNLETVTVNAFSLLGLGDFSSSPVVWNNTNLPERVGLSTRVYRFSILVNNTQEFYINQSQPVIDLPNEAVNFSFSEKELSGIDINSTVIKDEENNSVFYEIVGEEIFFVTEVNSSQERWFTVTFDDDSNFTSRSTSVAGTNNLTERNFPVDNFRALQHRQILQLNASDYFLVKNITTIKDFHIKLTDLNTGDAALDYGAEIPLRGDVVALQRFVIYQNSTASLNSGRLVVQTW